MINVDLQQLVQALDAATKHDLETAAERCVVRGGSKILVEDLLLGLLEDKSAPKGPLVSAIAAQKSRLAARESRSDDDAWWSPRRPPDFSRPRRFAKAGTGSEKNIEPKREHSRSNGISGTATVAASA